MKTPPSFTHPHVILHLYDIFALVNTKLDVLQNVHAKKLS